MNIIATGLGYRELQRVADFITKYIDNATFNEMVDTYDIIDIGYDLHYDSVTIDAGMEDGTSFEDRFYPEDLT